MVAALSCTGSFSLPHTLPLCVTQRKGGCFCAKLAAPNHLRWCLGSRAPQTTVLSPGPALFAQESLGTNRNPDMVEEGTSTQGPGGAGQDQSSPRSSGLSPADLCCDLGLV